MTSDQRAAAAVLLADAEAGLRPATAAEKRKWLAILGAATVSTLTAEEAALKVSAYVTLIGDVPAALMSDVDVQRRAARVFKFFPAYQEVAEFLDAETDAYRAMVKRLRAVVAAPDALPTPTKPKAPPPSAEDHHRRWMERQLAGKSPEDRDRIKGTLAALRDGTPAAAFLGPFAGMVGSEQRE